MTDFIRDIETGEAFIENFQKEALEKRRVFNQVYNSYKNQVINGFINKLAGYPYLIKGSSAWCLNFPEAQNNSKTDISMAFTPQNFDIEIYVNETKLDDSIQDIYEKLYLFTKIDTEGSSRRTRSSSRTKSILYTNLQLSPNVEVIGDRAPQIHYSIQPRELFKSFPMSLCFELSDESQRKRFKGGFTNTGCDGMSVNHHSMIYLTVIPIRDGDYRQFTEVYYPSITETFRGDFGEVKALNQRGLLLYDTFIKTGASRKMEKKIDIDSIRLKYMFDKVVQNDSKRIRQAYIEILNLINSTLKNYDNIFPDKYFFKNLNRVTIDNILDQYKQPQFPDGIRTFLDGIVIRYFREYLNSLVIDLNRAMKEYYKDVFTFIAGGDAFERYIKTGKIADIDIKVIMLYMLDVFKRQSSYRQEIRNKINRIMGIIMHILTKHLSILNTLLNDKNCYLEKDLYSLFTEECDKQDVSQFYRKYGSESLLLCPLESKAYFRIRTGDINYRNTSDGVEGVKLITIDYRKKFDLHLIVNNQPVQVPYTYSLAIFDAPLNFKPVSESAFNEEVSNFERKNIVNFPCRMVNDKFKLCYTDEHIRRSTILNLPRALKLYCRENNDIKKYMELYTKDKETRTILASDELTLTKVKTIQDHPDFLGLPVASPYFLAEDILVKFRTKDLFGRYYSGKIEKDKVRVNAIKDINDNSTCYLSYNNVSLFYLCSSYGYPIRYKIPTDQQILDNTLFSVYGMINKETKWFKENFEYVDQPKFSLTRQPPEIKNMKEYYDLLSNYSLLNDIITVNP